MNPVESPPRVARKPRTPKGDIASGAEKEAGTLPLHPGEPGGDGVPQVAVPGGEQPAAPPPVAPMVSPPPPPSSTAQTVQVMTPQGLR